MDESKKATTIQQVQGPLRPTHELEKTKDKQQAQDPFAQRALRYHSKPTAGKIAIQPTKPLANQIDLSLAYSPGVAVACEAIVDEPNRVFDYTSKGNLVAVITNGTAVLGLGNIGPVAAKPVMEGKAVLFKKFADIDSIDLEVDTRDVDKFIDIVSALEPTFGAINLEDIKAPDCFAIERGLREKMNIPVFHDDQHGTAIVTSAALLNALELANKNINSVKVMCIGAGAAALSCLDLFTTLGVQQKHIQLFDGSGHIYAKRQTWQADDRRAGYAHEGEPLSIEQALVGADVLLGLSAGNVVQQEWLAGMQSTPIIFALANPNPEIAPELIYQVHPDAIVATGRSDYPNQVNNVLCFPFIFRGALDVGATDINDEMKHACVHSIAELAKKELSDAVASAYAGVDYTFGKSYLIPKPFDVRLMTSIAPAVARAAMDSGVATRPIEDFAEYKHRLQQLMYQTGSFMRPFLSLVRDVPNYRVAYAEGEEERVLRAAQLLADESIVYPVLIGRRSAIQTHVKTLGLRMQEGRDYDICDVQTERRKEEYYALYHSLQGRNGVNVAAARRLVRTDTTVLASLLVKQGHVDGMLCGVTGGSQHHYQHVRRIIGGRTKDTLVASMSILVLEKGFICMADAHAFQPNTPEEVAQLATVVTETLQSIGIEPRIAFISDANFGSNAHPNSVKMRRATELFAERYPHIEADGEMRVDTAMNADLRQRLLQSTRLKNNANVLIFPNIEVARVTYSAVRGLQECYPIGPIMMGTAHPVHVLNGAASVRSIYNTSVFAALGIHARNAKKS